VTRTTLRRCVAPTVACAATVVLTACGSQASKPPVLIDGSSTVAPLSSAASELFAQQHPGANVPVGTSGTGGGFQKFCTGQTDISDASRPVGPEEKALCERNGVEFTELHVANDALTVTVNPQNTWVDCLTVEQLQTIWSPQSERRVTNWNQVDPSFPNVPLTLFGPGTDSGTFDYFTEAINGEEGASRSDYAASEDDNILVQGVQGSKGALAYFGYTYYEENKDSLKAVAIDGGEGCTEPSPQAVKNGTYKPLARPLFIYVNNESFATNSQVAEFVRFYANNIDKIVKAAQFVPLNEQQKAQLQQRVASMGGQGQ
jgi:phosphate transport system substrate-binding protein